MAKVPRFSTKSSGQGVSRKSYQVGRSLGNRGSGAAAGGAGGAMVPKPGQVSAGASGGIASGIRSYPKGGATSAEYGPEVMAPNNLQSLQAISKGKSPKAPKGFL